MAIIIIAGTFFGGYLDERESINTPTYTVIFSLISIFFALYYVFKKVKNEDEAL